MRNRKSLQPNTKLRFTNRAGGEMHYAISGVIGRGGSCIVYEGYYINNAGSANVVRIKECYPYKLNITRNDDGTLCASENEEKEFQKYKQRIRQAFDVAIELRQTMGLSNSISDAFDIYEANNTVYIVSSYAEGCTMENTEFASLKDVVRAVISTAKSVEKIHERGYLYLDIKPENIFIYNETFSLIQLFDFDSVIPINADETISDYKVSYSVGFAPIEQKEGKLSRIGKYTDVYSLGALLFYLLFGRIAKATDCGFDEVYDYSNLKWDIWYKKKLFGELDKFFHNTLQSFPADRYQSIREAIIQLGVIEKYASMPEPFICSCQMTNKGVVVGREKECNKILSWYESTEKLIFITGMGGIGKSTIIRKFVDDNREKFDNLIYLSYRGSVCETIIDDERFCINGYEKDESEANREYFERKLSAVRELLNKEKTLLVIDNFDGTMDDDFAKLLKLNWKIIIATRSDMSDSGCTFQRVEEFSDRNEMYSLFENNMGRKLKTNEYNKVDSIAKMVAGHTLALVLIARQIARSFLDMDTALRLVENSGFSGIAPEKVKYMQDSNEYYDKISAIIMSAYDVSGLSKNKKKCMKVLSLFDVPGIGAIEAKALLKLQSLDDINELIDMGWLEVTENNIGMHPLIQEIMHQVSWTDEYRGIAKDEMQILCERISSNQKKDIWISKSVLKNAGKDSILSDEDIYKKLLFVTIMNMPKEYEDYIINNCEKLFGDRAFQDKYSVIELYDYVVYLECQKSNIGEAEKYLGRAKSFANTTKDDYVRGIYYDMLGDYYDEILSGAYYSNDKEEREIFYELLSATEKACHHMGKSKHPRAKSLYAKYTLGRAGLLIRGTDNKYRKIKALISRVSKVATKSLPEYDEIRSLYNMELAWYYTLCEPDIRKVWKYLEAAAEANNCRNISSLDEIDYFYIPAANMMYELGNADRAMELLDEACKICDEYEDLIPYNRKKKDLLEYKLEVYSQD